MKAGTSEAQRRRLGEGGLVVAVDAHSQRLLRYEEQGTRGTAAMDAHCWGERDAVEARSGRNGPALCRACLHSSISSCTPSLHRALWLLCRLADYLFSSSFAVFHIRRNFSKALCL